MAVVDEMMKSVVFGEILVRNLVFLLGFLEAGMPGVVSCGIGGQGLEIGERSDGWVMNTSADEYDFVCL